MIDTDLVVRFKIPSLLVLVTTPGVSDNLRVTNRI